MKRIFFKNKLFALFLLAVAAGCVSVDNEVATPRKGEKENEVRSKGEEFKKSQRLWVYTHRKYIPVIDSENPML